MPKANGTYCYIANLLIVAAIIDLVVGCAPSMRGIRTTTEECAPCNLIIKPDDHKLSLKWDINCPEGTILSGYFIYLREKPIYEKYHSTLPPSSIKPFNPTPYPGDTDPEDNFETMMIENLDNGVEYFVSVRTVFPDKTISVSSNEVSVICRPEGEFELAFRYAGLNDGFSFALGQPIRADGDANDLYFFSKDGFDFIASPNRLNGFLRKSEFYSLGKTKDIYEHPELNLDIPSVEKMPIFEGESYLIKTADNNYAKIRIEKISGENKERTLRITYIYQTARNLMRF